MTSLAEAMNIAAPIYNLALVAVLVVMFFVLFNIKSARKEYMKPWYFLFAVICVFILEEITTVLRTTGVIVIKEYINGFFELIIISLVVYLLLLQREHLKNFE